jgi:serine/threonine-protein kinase
VTAIPDRLTAALSDRYRLERELGQGGMATVYLAEDLKHKRKVAVKVLRAEVAASLGGDRFTREIEVAAALQHPHILPLLDSGEADGFLYYVMPYVDGESLRERLDREGELPIHDAVKILAEVADALAAAHAKGVVHRDIKPDNVMLSGRHALVMDFGVAKAVSEATGRQNITTVGVALGTPTYMAPEQAVADPALDHRVDIYALGAMGYELLLGRPPFVGRTPQEVLAAHVTQQPDPISPRRPAVPPQLESVVMRCLAKRPADRWQTAEELLRQLESLATPTTGVTPTETRPLDAVKVAGPRRWILGAVAAAVLAVAGFFGLRDRPAPSEAALNPNLIAILPFRVTAPDSSLHYLAEGMVDLLSAMYTGVGGPRAIDARSSIAAWNRESIAPQGESAAIAAAGSVGAGLYLLGSIVTTRDRVVINATVGHVEGTGPPQQARVEGPIDGLSNLLEGLVGQLLAQNAGLSGERTAALPSSLEAVRAYAQGRAANRRALWDEGASHFARAIGIDSSFTLAQIGMLESARWIPEPVPGIARITERAWAARDQVAPRDRAMLRGYTGGNGPAPNNYADEWREWEETVRQFPDLGEAWYWLGEAYLHGGQTFGVENHEELALRAFAQTRALDPATTTAMIHPIELAAVRQDSLEADRLLRLHLALDSTSHWSTHVRFFHAMAHDDPAAMHRALDRLAESDYEAMSGWSWQLAMAGRHLEFADTIFALQARFGSAGVRQRVEVERRNFLLNLGRPAEAAALTQNAGVASDLMLVLTDAWGVPAAGSMPAALDRLTRLATGPSAGDANQGGVQYAAACAVAQWRLVKGSTLSVEPLLAMLRKGTTGTDATTGEPEANPVCVALLEAMLAVHNEAPDRLDRVVALDSLSRLGTSGDWGLGLVVAQLFDRLGRTEDAYRASQRGGNVFALLNAVRRVRGELAERLGHREDAIEQYQLYLANRQDPEAVLIPERDAVRAALARLLGEPEANPPASPDR